MFQFIHLDNPNMSFRRQLLTVVLTGILVLALVAASVTAWVTSRGAEQLLVLQGQAITRALAGQSVLALLYESADNAREPLQGILEFPDVVQAAVYDHQGDLLLVMGQGPLLDSERFGDYSARFNRQMLEMEQAWLFTADVTLTETSGEDDLLGGDPEVGDNLGYVIVVMSKGTLEQLRAQVFFYNVGIVLAVALLLSLLINVGIKRLTRPLLELYQIMGAAERPERHVRAELNGPREIQRIARGFNSMMQTLEERDLKLRAHSESLESQVALRTRELVEARDAAMTASRHKSEFLANMSHELRTPLHAIIGYSELVQDELECVGNEEAGQQIGRVVKSGEHLLMLINNILSLSKIEAGRMELQVSEVDMGHMLQEAADAVMPLMQRNNNRLETSIYPEVTDRLAIDREKLLQAMINLLSNSAKFTSDGIIRLQAELTSDQLMISVSDTGIGIHPEQQAAIFDPFRQVDGSDTRQYEGTGLGLAITKQFCELMGGSIAVKSVPNERTEFTIRIPLPIRTQLDVQSENQP